jgi:hypothetical protein|tara:strand:+ start:1312 stop:1593 length:282 start_codon:yes stop_codon:yes gene_type:complete
MYILAVLGQEENGAYSASNEEGDQVLYMFEERDDATRFGLLLETDHEYPEMTAVEVDDNAIIKTCDNFGYMYMIITKNDIVIPPKDILKNDFI